MKPRWRWWLWSAVFALWLRTRWGWLDDLHGWLYDIRWMAVAPDDPLLREFPR